MFLDTTDLSDGEIYLHLDRTADANEEKGYVPAYYFKIMRCEDDAEVGTCDLRIGHNHNTKYAGNVGYEVYEAFRGNHYAAKACRLLFKLAKKHNMKEVVITCSPENTASRKTCEYAGAEFMGIVDLPEWHELYKEGQRKTCRYIKRL
ncbi:MAG: GNAT family N-acetyltransferase [Firmicutes bacterium]|jgi:tagatose 1,6-diphosphate aldolase|nr:GNAT family N-acetyltransferase [Bacillota bacterium]